MEKAQTIMYIVFTSVGVLAYIITTILAIKRKKAKGEAVDVDEVLSGISEQVMDLVKGAEKAFASLEKGGALKLKDVLNDTRELCEHAGLTFDKEYWTEFIEKAVELINYNRKTEEKSEEKTTDSTTPAA